MCTRFFIEPDNEEFREIIAQARRSKLAEQFLKAGSPLIASGEVRPTALVPVIAPNTKGEICVFPMNYLWLTLPRKAKGAKRLPMGNHLF